MNDMCVHSHTPHIYTHTHIHISSSTFTGTVNVQFVLVTANQNEYDSLKSFLGHSKMPTVKDTIAQVTFEGDDMLKNNIDVPTNALSGKYFIFRAFGKQSKTYHDIAVMKCISMGSSGHHGSRMETLELLFKASHEKWHPQAIFIIGCCGSTTDEVGTVLVSSNIIHYNRGKITQRGMEWKPDSSYSSNGQEWFGNIQQMQQIGDHTRRIVSRSVDRFLSGDYVVKDERIAEILSQRVPDPSTVGFEMEGLGVAEAVTIAKSINSKMPLFAGTKLPLPEYVIVKSVSDHVGQDKNKPCRIQFFGQLEENIGEDERQQKSTIMAATLVLRAIVHYA